MIKRSIYRNLVLLISTMLLASCASIERVTIRPTRKGFTTELDAAAERGKLKRISPEQSDVFDCFTLSNDELHIVFSGVQSGGGDQVLHLWKINSDSSGAPIKITAGGTSDFHYPSFTSDGKFIVYESGGQIWKVSSDGSGGKLRIPGTGGGNDSSPHLSKSDKLVFTGAYGTTHMIWTCNLDGSDLTQIREGKYPKWSPDESKIVFMYDGEIWTVNANGTDLTQITNTYNIFENLPSFSPDGKKIVYSSNEGTDGKPSWDINIWAMNLDGSQKTQLTELNSWDSWPIWGRNGVYFLSGRAQRPGMNIKRIWLLRTPL